MSIDCALLSEADQVRRTHLGDEVHLRGLIEISNYCRCNCLYCGLRRDNQQIRRYRMNPREILTAAEQAAKFRYGTVVLQAGEDPKLKPEIIAEVVAEIKKMGLAVTLSLGEWDHRTYLMWRQAGADRYLMRHETADQELYATLRPDRRLEDRLRNLEILRELGYQIGAGFMIGLPGNHDPDHTKDLAFLARLQPDMVGVGPFIPNPQTPLGTHTAPALEQTLSILARVRLALPDAHMPSTTALETLYPQGRRRGLQAGANVIMPNLTPWRFKQDYQLYPGKATSGEADQTHRSILQLLAELERPVGKGPGHSIRTKEDPQCQD